MPIYKYKCKKCNKSFEELVTSADSKTPCENCNVQAERQFGGGFSIKFIGSGFYNTDYGKK